MIYLITVLKITSTPAKYMPKMKEETTTAIVVLIVSSFEGQVTFLSSALASAKNVFTLCNIFVFMILFKTGQEGLEPPTPGFGDRYSTN